MMVACGHVLAYPYNGDNMQWSNPGAGAMANHYRQQPGFGGGAGFGGGNFGRVPTFGGQPQWQSTGYGGAEAYQTNIFNEPDRYGYDYTIPGATVHFLMYKKREYTLHLHTVEYDLKETLAAEKPT